MLKSKSSTYIGRPASCQHLAENNGSINCQQNLSNSTFFDIFADFYFNAINSCVYHMKCINLL